ncbi:PLDc N-terminal domain-containing protein [Pseudoalteromonas rubra]|nr:PLDc N-terminal domain-containing protein [Pseudoalteromonas rubra]
MFSKQTSRTQKIVWCLLSFMFSWVGYLSYYFFVVRSLGKDNT